MRRRSNALARSFSVKGAEAETTLVNTDVRVDCTLYRSAPEKIRSATFISLPIIITTVSIPIDGLGLRGSRLPRVFIDKLPSLWRADRVGHPQLFLISWNPFTATSNHSDNGSSLSFVSNFFSYNRHFIWLNAHLAVKTCKTCLMNIKIVSLYRVTRKFAQFLHFV